MISPLIDNMIRQYGYPLLHAEDLDTFIGAQAECVLFFSEDPARFPESNDVAMILPELVKEYGGRFAAAVIGQQDQRSLQARYGFREWPTLVFLRRGAYLGHVSRVQDWVDYLAMINDILGAETRPDPGFSVAVDIQPGAGVSQGAE